MSPSGFAKTRVLVVDDFDNFRMTVMRMLQEFGAEQVDTASSGSDALRKCRAAFYDLVLCDYNLGHGKSGQQVLEQLRHEKLLKNSALFVLISAESSKNIVMAAYDYEPDAYLTKPITAMTLQQRLERLFRQRAEMKPIYDALDEDNINAAIDRCRGLIDSNSRYRSHCQKLLGQLLLSSGNYVAAEGLYRQVLDSRELDWAQVGLAAAKKGQNDWMAAQQWVEQALGVSDMCMPAYDLLASIQLERGDLAAQQKTLEKAVDISPLSVIRQQNLGALAFRNQDMAVATQAYKSSVKLGEHSCYDTPQVHLQFVRACSELSRRDPEQGKAYARDVMRVLGEFENRFGGGFDNRLLLHSAACAFKAATGDVAGAKSLLGDLRERTEGQTAALEARIDWVSACDALGEREQRDELIKALLDEFKGDQQALESIDRVLESPVSDKNRKRVADINKKGIACYDSADFTGAVACFTQAAAEFPKHVGIELNLLQALLGSLEAEQGGAEQLDKALATRDRLEQRVPVGHAQASRYAQLKAKLAELAHQFSSDGL